MLPSSCGGALRSEGGIQTKPSRAVGDRPGELLRDPPGNTAIPYGLSPAMPSRACAGDTRRRYHRGRCSWRAPGDPRSALPSQAPQIRTHEPPPPGRLLPPSPLVMCEPPLCPPSAFPPATRVRDRPFPAGVPSTRVRAVQRRRVRGSCARGGGACGGRLGEQQVPLRGPAFPQGEAAGLAPAASDPARPSRRPRAQGQG